jgi:uncharacterized small protein (DUF1192 family)
MLTLKELERKIASLEAEISTLQSQGSYRIGYWLDTTQNRKGTEYTRARWMENGKRRCYTLSNLQEKVEWMVAIARGDRIAALQSELADLCDRLQLLKARIAKLAG